MDSEKQKDEITALESIYIGEEFSYHKENELYNCTFNIFINIPTGYYFTYCNNRFLEESTEKVHISHLPPLTLCVTLPKNYPSTSPPKFSLYTTWLCQTLLTKLCLELDKLWVENKGQEILFVWIGFLQNETLQFLGIETSLDINYVYTAYKIALDKQQNFQRRKDGFDIKQLLSSESSKYTDDICNINGLQKKCYEEKKHRNIDKRAISDYKFGDPVQLLIDYNEKCNEIKFNKSLHTCKICFTDTLGEHCMKFLLCSHVFCKNCITGYMEVKIQDGSVNNIQCPENKCTSEATPGQVKDLVSPEMFAKYDSILLNITLDSMTDIVYCPRRQCQYPVSRDLNESVATCPVCHYAFCIFCNMLYHGIEPCKDSIAGREQLVNEYQNASHDEKLNMERKYGEKQLKILVENVMSEQWITKNSHYCPYCNVAIEKSHGCNKMFCSKCRKFFCWLCGKKLNSANPYEHFSDPKSKCFKMLNHNMIIDENDEEDDLNFHQMFMML